MKYINLINRRIVAISEEVLTDLIICRGINYGIMQTPPEPRILPIEVFCRRTKDPTNQLLDSIFSQSKDFLIQGLQ